MAWWSRQSELRQQPRWMFLTLALTLVGGGMATSFTRVNQLWQTERTRQTLESWLLAPLPTRALLGRPRSPAHYLPWRSRCLALCCS